MFKLPDFAAMYRDMAAVPQFARGQVWCKKCDATQKVDGANCLRHGWPKCCGETMTLDSPEERAVSTA